jgi:thiol-disulfide isomerase/thioredoxin
LTDYLDQLSQDRGTSGADGVAQIMLRLDKEGQVSFTDAEKEVIRQYPAMVKQFQEAINKVPDEEKQAMVDAFNNGELVKSFEALLTRYLDDVNNVFPFMSVESVTEVADSLGCDKTLRDILIARELCGTIDNVRKALPESMVKLVEEEITLPLAYHRVMGMHNKYLELQKRRASQSGKVNSANLKSGDEVKDMSDGEKILRKLIEPYKGKIILLDIWGTWCGPCKEALSHSQEEYARLAPYDMVFLYLANRSSEESWKNVIAEYEVVGDNVVHYNLPHEQQQAVERFLKVNSFPTYKLIDAFGNILPVNADPRNLDKMEELVKMISQ